MAPTSAASASFENSMFIVLIGEVFVCVRQEIAYPSTW
jgi:hypothetical protein